MTDLFTLPETLSPRLRWIREHCVSTASAPDAVHGMNDDLGDIIQPWLAWVGNDPSDSRNNGQGQTEDEALSALAAKKRWRMWNEPMETAKEQPAAD